MKIGILSDTHAHTERSHMAAKLLKQARVDLLIHAGDIGSEEVIYAIAEHFDFATTPFYAVWGNVDRHGYPAPDFPSWDGITIREVHLTLSLGGKEIAVTHGDDTQTLKRLIESQEYDVLITGHTHVAADERIGKTRVINPGAVTRSPRPSIATYNTETEDLDSFYLG